MAPCRSGAVNELPTAMPCKSADAMVAEFDNELVVLIPEARLAHLLDECLSLVLDSWAELPPTGDRPFREANRLAH